MQKVMGREPEQMQRDELSTTQLVQGRETGAGAGVTAMEMEKRGQILGMFRRQYQQDFGYRV